MFHEQRVMAAAGARESAVMALYTVVADDVHDSNPPDGVSETTCLYSKIIFMANISRGTIGSSEKHSTRCGGYLSDPQAHHLFLAITARCTLMGGLRHYLLPLFLRVYMGSISACHSAPMHSKMTCAVCATCGMYAR